MISPTTWFNYVENYIFTIGNTNIVRFGGQGGLKQKSVHLSH